MKNVILVTAFDSFGGRSYNPTERMLGLLPDDGIKKLLLPTSFTRAPELLRSAMKEISPAAVVSTGLASGRTGVSLEFAALNIKDSDIVCDNDGNRASGESVIPEDSRNALFTKLDLGRYAAIVRDSGIPCRVSYHAGTFVCNCVYYHLLSFGVPCVFIHIPDDEASAPSDDAPRLPLDSSAAAVSILISELKKSFE
ncbi:MAG: pyroglutamyl-peptidase I [Clostridia bacterium]|nr:pyroglutamyl-peptidase I [Clostridia bacterium]